MSQDLPTPLRLEQRSSLIRRACLSPHISNADIDAINAAFDAQTNYEAFRQKVATELNGLISHYADSAEGEPALGLELTVTQWKAYNARIREAATAFGLDLAPPPSLEE